jgi:hypothetical protein
VPDTDGDRIYQKFMRRNIAAHILDLIKQRGRTLCPEFRNTHHFLMASDPGWQP